MIHKLKTLPAYFERVKNLDKRFEIRKNDRGFQAGDGLILEEWTEKDGYTGRSLTCHVTYVLHGFEGLADGYVALSINVTPSH